MGRGVGMAYISPWKRFSLYHTSSNTCSMLNPKRKLVDNIYQNFSFLICVSGTIMSQNKQINKQGHIRLVSTDFSESLKL